MGEKEFNNSYTDKALCIKSVLELPHACGLVRVGLCTDSQDLTRPCNKKFRPPIELQTNLLYKIACAYCSWSSIGETGRGFSKRKKEHIQNIKSCKTGCNIAPHAWRESIESPHAWSIDFNVTMLE